MTDIEMTAMMTAMMTDMMTAMKTDMMIALTDMMVTNQDIVMVIEKKEIEIMRTMVLIERDIDPCRHYPRKSERYPNCPESHIKEQMDENVQSSVNILKNVNKLLNK